MPPSGTLTAAQHQIMEVVWSAGDQGVSVSEIWMALGHERKLARTTVLNQVDRLEKRGWLQRDKQAGSAFRYRALLDRETTAKELTQEFVDSFFGGSASHLVSSLIDAQRLQASDLQELRRLVDAQLRDGSTSPATDGDKTNNDLESSQ